MDNIYISIIVPAYNIENHIGRCLESLIRQTYKFLEIIVVDDGSTDGTGNVIEKYALRDKRIQVIYKENGGVSDARITGIKRARGEYIGFVDGDDYVEPDMFYHLLQNAIRFQADISHCGYKMVCPDGHEDFYYGTGKVVKQDKRQGLEDLLRGDYVEPGLCNKLYKTSIISSILDAQCWDSRIKINEDLLMNYIFFKNANISIYEDKTFYHYILRKESASTSKKQHYKITDPLRVIELIRRDIENEKDNILMPIAYSRYLRILINIAMQNDWKKDAIEAKEKLKREIINGNFFKECSSIKIKLMVLGVVYFRGIYKCVRLFYEKVTGISRKFEIK